MARQLLIAVLLAVTVLAADQPSAVAQTGGFFVMEDEHSVIVGSEGEGHNLDLATPGLEGEMGCENAFQSTFLSSTLEGLSFFPLYSNCVRTDTGGKISVDQNGCAFTFRVAKDSTEETEQTLELGCPGAQTLVITRSNCTIVIPPQTNIGGVTYAPTTSSGFAALTVTINAKLSLQYEAGSCTSLGTKQTGTLKGSLVFKAYNTLAEPAGITITWEEVGHFASGVEHPTIVGSESEDHHLDLIAHGLAGEIGCEKSTYSLTYTSEIAQVTTVAPKYENCTTTGGDTVSIEFFGCQYRFDVVKGPTNETEQQVDLVCPTANIPLIIHPNCWMRISPQNNVGQITYTNVEEGGHDAITLDVKAEFDIRFEAGICVFTGTNHTGTLLGSVTAKALDTAGEQVSLTAT